MEETIDYQAVVHQLQVENEILRNNMKLFLEAKKVMFQVPDLVESWYHQLVAHKYTVMVALMIVYWVLNIGITIWDRFAL
jgi:hypothetical protein